MSLDFSLTEVREVDIFDSNYTHNVVPMWRAAGVYDALYMSDGKTASEIIVDLVKGLDYFETHRIELEAMNPTNGWGSYEGAKRFLRETVNACMDSPKAKIRISK